MNTSVLSRQDVTQDYSLRASHVQETTKKEKLNDTDRLVANVAGVIAGVVAGIFATIGGFFLLVIFGGEFLSFGATLGGSLLIGAGGAVGAFFIFKYGLQAIIKAGNNGGHSVGDHHTVKPVKTHSTKQPTVSPSKVGYCNKQFEQFGKEYVSAQEKMQKTILVNIKIIADQVKASLEQGEISEEMANNLLEDFKNAQLLIAVQMKILGEGFAGNFAQFAKVLALPALTKEGYHTALHKFSTLVMEGFTSQKEIATQQQGQMKEGGEKWKLKFQDESFSEVVDTMVDKLSANLGEVIGFYEVQNHNLIKLLGGFENCF